MSNPHQTPADSGQHEHWETPTDDLVTQVLMRLGNIQHRKIFYAALENPEWVRALAARRVFDNAPESAAGDGNEPWIRLWPEGDYLARMAALVPDQVAPLLERVAATQNIWVQQIIVRAVTEMPGSLAKSFAPFIATYMKGLNHAYLESGKLVAIAAELQSSGFPKQALQVLSALYRPERSPDSSDTLIGRIAVHAGLDEYSYERWLPKSVSTLVSMGEQGLGTVTSWLVEYERLTRTQALDADYDLSHMWRPNIAPDDQEHMGNEIGHALINAVLSAAERLQGSIDLDAIVAKLEAKSEPLLRRISLALLAQVLESEAEPSPENMALALAQLTDRRSVVVGLWNEYARLARVVLSKTSKDVVAAWVTFVRSNEIFPPEQEIRQIIAYSNREAEEVTSDEVADYRNRRRRELLATIGEGSLPDELAEELRRLATAYALSTTPTEPAPVHVSGFTGPASPLTQDEINNLAPDALIAYLDSWRPTSTQLWGPSIGGLARQVEQLVRGNPDYLAPHAFAMRELPIPYLQAVLSGWAQAIADGKTFAMRSVWSLALYVAHQSDTERTSAPDQDDFGIVWRHAQQLVARLVSMYVQKEQPLSIDLVETLWRILRPLTVHHDPTPEREAESLSSGTDPLTLSLNSTRPIALRVSAQLLNALDRRKLLPETPGLLKQILQRLTSHVGPSADSSLAVAAVFGEVIGILMNVSPDWVRAHEDVLFGGIASTDSVEQAWSDAAFSVAIAAYQPSMTFLSFMRPWYAASLVPSYLARSRTVGWRNQRSAEQHIGDHLLLLLIYSAIEYDDPLIQLLFSNTTPEARGDVLGHLGWQFMHADREDAVKTRARALIDWRVEEIQAGRASAVELNGFYWWVRADKFPADWWLPILDLATTDPDFDPHGMIGVFLVKAARDFPQETVQIIARLLDGRARSWQRYDLIENAPPILASALESTDTIANEAALTLMDRLGRDGFTDLAEAVNRYRTR